MTSLINFLVDISDLLGYTCHVSLSFVCQSSHHSVSAALVAALNVFLEVA